MKPIKVLVASDNPQVMRDEFTRLGHHAWSWGINSIEGDNDYHFTGELSNLMEWDWDLVILNDRIIAKPL